MTLMIVQKGKNKINNIFPVKNVKSMLFGTDKLVFTTYDNYTFKVPKTDYTKYWIEDNNK